MMATLPLIHAYDEAPGIVAAPDRIDAWMAIAKPGDRFVYASRLCLPVASRGAKRMRDLAARGLVDLCRPRSKIDPTIFNYTAQRTSKPTALVKPDRPRLVVPSAALVDDEAAIVDALLPVLARFAAHGRPCPTDRQLAEKARLTEDAVKLGLPAMVSAHLILIHGCSAPTYRRITILSTGQMTGIAA
jgi:hypothetical protein